MFRMGYLYSAKRNRNEINENETKRNEINEMETKQTDMKKIEGNEIKDKMK